MVTTFHQSNTENVETEVEILHATKQKNKKSEKLKMKKKLNPGP